MTRAGSVAWGVAGVALLLAALGWAWAPGAFAHAWLAAVVAWSGWPLGSLALLLVHSLTGGRWGEAVRPGLLLGVGTLPLMLPALVPVLLLLPQLYPWARPGAETMANHAYLNWPFFAVRGVAYLLAWLGLAAVALRGGELVRRVAPVGLLLLALTVTFAAVDLTESLAADFNSSAWGMLAMSSMAVTALGIAVALAAGGAPASVLPDLGKLMLALVLLWGYLEFMQLLIIWSSNLVQDAPWYARRMRGGWGWVLALSALLRLGLPFGLLIFPRVQRNRTALAALGASMAGVEVLRAWWVVLPEAGPGFPWLAPVCAAALGGVVVGWALRRRRVPAGVAAHV